MFQIRREQLMEDIRRWLDEDVGMGDITTMATIPADHTAKGIIHAKEAGIIAGLFIAEMVFAEVDKELKFRAEVEEGSAVSPGTVLAVVEGKTRSILTGERLALNLMQRLSGIATKTRQFVDALDGMHVRLVDTRKTTPGHRYLEKYAVRVGGGHNHRFGLFDAVLIKDNHIIGAGGITNAVRAARDAIPHTMKIEVEVETLEQLEEAIGAGADIIMLDNMDPIRMEEAVKRVKTKAPHILVEASGGVTLKTVKRLAQTGVDVISVGSLTYSAQALDISLDLNEKKGQSV